MASAFFLFLRLISEDTYEGEIENPQSLNMYVYVENNPLTYQDPSEFRIPGSSGCMYQDDTSLLIYQTEIRKNPEDMQYNDKSKEQLKDILGWYWKYFDEYKDENDLRNNLENLVTLTSISDGDMEDMCLVK